MAISMPHRSPRKLILASSSPRRKELLAGWGYEFSINTPADDVEVDIAGTTLTAIELVKRSAKAKAENVALCMPQGLVLAADTVAECHGKILGKPADRQHAAEMLRTMSGQRHYVHSAICLWSRPTNQYLVESETTRLVMDDLADDVIDAYLESGMWQGKAGGFGYQDDLDWIRIEQGSESNVVGLPKDLLERMLAEFEAG